LLVVIQKKYEYGYNCMVCFSQIRLLSRAEDDEGTPDFEEIFQDEVMHKVPISTAIIIFPAVHLWK